MEEERRRREDIEATLKEQWLMWMQERERMMEAERQRAEAERQRYDAMFAYVQARYWLSCELSTAANGGVASPTSATDGLCSFTCLCCHSCEYECNTLHTTKLNIDFEM